MEYIIAAYSDIGNIRKVNQDNYLVKMYQTDIGTVVLAVICDGMGGLEQGEIASSKVICAFDEWAGNMLPSLCGKEITEDDIRNEWDELLVFQNEELKKYSGEQGIRMGTTVTAMLLTEQKYYIVNLGDTRAYKIREMVSLLTKDHSLVEWEVDQGNITREEAKTDKRRNILLQCIGATREVFPDFYFGDVEKGCVYMLCSDGFRHEITEEEIATALEPQKLSDTECMREQLNYLTELNKRRNEKDNITAVLIRTL